MTRASLLSFMVLVCALTHPSDRAVAEPILGVGYVCDAGLWQQANDNSLNYWEQYLYEITDMLGLRSAALSLADLSSAAFSSTIFLPGD